MPTYPLYTAVMAKLDAKTRFYRLDPATPDADLDHLKKSRDACDESDRRD
jgi:hypothetical protein